MWAHSGDHCLTVCDCLSSGLHRCGRWSEGWVSSSWGNSRPSQLPPSPCAHCNPTQGAAPPLLHAPSLPAQMSQWRMTRLSWTWDGLTDRALTLHCRHGWLGFLPPTTSDLHGTKDEWSADTELIYFGDCLLDGQTDTLMLLKCSLISNIHTECGFGFSIFL